MSDALRFGRLFRGREDAYGTGVGGVVRAPVNVGIYQQHLDGHPPGVGIFPMVDGDVVYFGAIDLDEPNFALARSMQKLLPGTSFIERSRSGNAHVWVFFAHPAPAWAVKGVLRKATEAVGRKDVEVFPKQDALREGMVGNYINLPYHGADRPVLYDGDPHTPMSLPTFLAHAEDETQDPAEWIRRARGLGVKPPAEREETGEWGEAPVLHACAQHIIAGILDGSRPLMPGARHQVLFHLAKQLLNWRDFTQAEAWSLMQEVNAALPRPLIESELERTFGNALTGQFTSTGCDDPLMAPYVLPSCPIAQR